MRQLENIKKNQLATGSGSSTDIWMYRVSCNYTRDTIEDGLLIEYLQMLVLEYSETPSDYAPNGKEGIIIEKIRCVRFSIKYKHINTIPVEESGITPEDFKFIRKKLREFFKP